MSAETPGPDPVFARVCESSARLMSGSVSRPTMKDLQKSVAAATGEYPWQDVVDRILRDPIDPAQLTAQALRAQRDWVVRGGRETPGKSVTYHAKSFVARALARLVFLSVLLPLLIALLVLLKHRWPDVDIYRVLGWLGEVWPSVFGTR